MPEFALENAASNLIRSKGYGDDLWILPLADRFIIDRNGVIRYAEADADYTVRPEPQHTIEALKSII